MADASIGAGSGRYIYAIGIGSNRPLTRSLGPTAIVEAAFAALNVTPLRLLARSPIIPTRPLGPSIRTYANGAALVTSPLLPFAMLDHLQRIEHLFGRRRYRRWGARTLDLDLLLWSGGKINGKRLVIPHPAFRERVFVLTPLETIAPRWHDPASGSTIRQLMARFEKPKPVDRRNHSF